MAIVHYKGDIGEFDYDDTLWYIKEKGSGASGGHLRCKDVVFSMPVINVPSGLIDCSYLFHGHDYNDYCEFTEKVTIVFDESVTVLACSHMFMYCEFSKGAVIKGLSTCRQTNLDNMFHHMSTNGTVVIEKELRSWYSTYMFNGSLLSNYSFKLILDLNKWGDQGSEPFNHAYVSTEDLSKISVVNDDYSRVFREAYLDSDPFIFNKPATRLVNSFTKCKVPKKYFEVHLCPSEEAYKNQKFTAHGMLSDTYMRKLEILDLYLDLDQSRCS